MFPIGYTIKVDLNIMQRARQYISTAIKTHPFNFFTLVIALLALGCAWWAAYEAHRQAVAAEGARMDAQKASVEQQADVERSRKAAEASAQAAKDLAEGMRQNARASQTMAEASKDSAQAAQRSAQFAETSFQTSHRAYMVVDGANLESPPNETEPVKVSLTFKNVGSTPAVSVNAGWGMFLIPTLSTIPLDHVPLPPFGTDHIGTNHSFIAHAVRDCSPAEKRSLLNKTTALVVVSVVYYKDIFGNAHRTESCGYWSNDGRGLVLGFCGNTLFHNPRLD